MSMRKHIAFASMCIGLFIAQLDIQIVSSSLNEIGGGCHGYFPLVGFLLYPREYLL